MFNSCFILVFLLVGVASGWPQFKHRRSDPDEFYPTLELIESKGYQAEQHQIVTDDGYILKIHRIPGQVDATASDKPRPVVLLQHGLLDVDSTWVINFPRQSLGFILADAGFDVWLGNMRGNTYGREHVSLKPEQVEFWDFSWQDMAHHDLPAMIDYILNRTAQSDLFYIGHSQGSLIGFTKFQDPAYQRKIRLFIGLGPVATVGHLKSPIKYVADLGKQNHQQLWYHLFGKRDFLPSGKLVQWIADKGCNEVITDRLLCENIIFALCGPSKYFNASRVSVYITHTPAGTSVKNLAHFAQMVISKKFQAYDYGSASENMKHYNQTDAPQFDLSRVNVPVGLYWAPNDWLADPADVELLRNGLPNVVDYYSVKDWDHLDFVWAIDAKQAIYDRMLALMLKYV